MSGRRFVPGRCARSTFSAAAPLAATLVALAACSATHPPPAATATPYPTPLPSGPVFSGAPPARMVLDSRSLGVSPDGVVRVLVRVAFRDARGTDTRLLGGGDVDFTSETPGVDVQWQTRMRFGAPAAIVSLARPASADVVVRASVGVAVPAARVRVGTAADFRPRAVAAALGPHLVQVGWTPAGERGLATVRVFRDGGRGLRLEGIVGPGVASFRDTTVVPGERYRYAVLLAGGRATTADVVVPPEVRGAPLAAFGGKAMWLSFSPSPSDANSYLRIDPRRIVARARASGLRALEVRVAYGSFWEITPDARPAIDALLDAATEAGISVVAWTVPRSTAFEDLATCERAVRYRSARGSRFAALAIDLERGAYFLGDGARGYAALTEYVPRVRAAVGTRYPIVATVEDPYLEHLSERDYPYAEIAADADVLQPMAYWRMLGPGATTPQSVRAALRASYAATRRVAGRSLPIDLGGQVSGETSRGAPSAADVAAAVREAHRLGALGITFFDWDGTGDATWQALATTPW